ncbi:MAG TPA: tRNA (N(6)-L-threonylcarbamoyladenosine(37)-C(2))-methylthiotransferase MtaB [Alphaproteobacteria bacterium]|nr:tRNA (N(6)-L-threonylcarbamoyladenosine(37)-C(2))-methylthiotransferase MtaB [Alphaproteobacteria bacterium]
MATTTKSGATIREPEVVTFGCRLNAYESEVVRAEAAKANLTNAIIVNTCAVTAEAERQARQTIRKKRRENPDAKIIVTGCAAQIDPAKFSAMPEVDHVIGNAEKMKAESYAALATDAAPRLQITDIMKLREAAGHLIDDFAGHARAFIEVQQGCDHRCTFCIIPYGRGNSRSLPMGDIVNQTRRLVANGYNEIVLSGVDITSYGPDLPGQPKLGQLVRRLLANVPELPRLRLSSIDVAEIESDDDLMELIAHEPRLMPHLHLSLQAGDDMILKRMKRRHSRAQAVEFCAKLRSLRPDMAFGADLIAGFPTETEEMFENSLKLVEDCSLAFLHVFPFSARAKTPAARMPQMPMEIRRERAGRLRQRGEAARDAYLARFVGRTVRAIMETPTLGRSEEFAAVEFAMPQEVGSIIETPIAKLENGQLIAGHPLGFKA